MHIGEGWRAAEQVHEAEFMRERFGSGDVHWQIGENGVASYREGTISRDVDHGVLLSMRAQFRGRERPGRVGIYSAGARFDT